MDYAKKKKALQTSNLFEKFVINTPVYFKKHRDKWRCTLTSISENLSAINIRYIHVLVFSILTVSTFGQKANIQASAGRCANCVAPTDGSGTLGLTYRKDTCGLAYIAISERVGQRFPPPGVVQPITLNVSGLPQCFAIEKAFLWCDASGSGVAINASITNPNNANQNFPMTMIGSGPDKCWGFMGSYSYRADVTSIVTGNGNYVFSNLPVSSTLGVGDDVDGILFMIIYRDLSATWEGHLLIHDGANVQISTATTESLTAINACGTSTTARAFCAIGDIQNVGTVVTMNNAVQTFNQEYWNYVDQPTTPITPATLNVDFSLTGSSDCYNLMMAGIYYQTTTCNVCMPATSNILTTTTTGESSCIDSTGTVSVQVSGGTPPYTYIWQPGGYTTSTVNNLPLGTYTVAVSDFSGCALSTDSASIIVVGAPTAQFNLTPSPTATFPGQICMTDQTINSTQWQWFVNGTPLSTASNDCYSLPDTGTYCVDLIATDANGCSDTATQCIRADSAAIIIITPESSLYIPNAFTPNGSGVNDLFLPVGEGISNQDYGFMIFDRWGLLLFETDTWGVGWDGTYKGRLCQQDVYVWKLKCHDINGKRYNLIGHVTLVK
jgi:gliding motility-associated-like protein